MLGNWESVEKATNNAKDSAGSAKREQEALNLIAQLYRNMQYKQLKLLETPKTILTTT